MDIGLLSLERALEAVEGVREAAGVLVAQRLLGNPAWTIVIRVPPSRGSNVNSSVVSKLDPSSRVSVEAIRIRCGRSIASNTWRWW